MISVITSYKCARACHGTVLPDLEEACQELYARGFFAVDIAISLEDLEEAFRDPDKTNTRPLPVRKAAEVLVTRIHKCTGQLGGSSIKVPMHIPALATHLPSISEISEYADEDAKTRRDKSIRYLAACLVVAHTLGTGVVEIVCGSRVRSTAGAEGQPDQITSYGSEKIVRKCRVQFAKGVVDAFVRAYEVLDIREWAHVAVALELEPDLVALARDFNDLNELLLALKAEVETRTDWGKSDCECRKDELAEHFGINLDWGHILLGADRGSYGKEAIKGLLTSVKEHVVHAHVADHYPGAHRADAPIGTFRPLSEYAELLTFHADLVQEWDAWHNDVKQGGQPSELNRFFSGAAAIELEARQDIEVVCRARDRLESLSKTCGKTLETSRDHSRDIEHRIAKADPDQGWLMGVNRAICDALEMWARCTGTPTDANENDDLLAKNDLDLIRAFLMAQAVDERTDCALAVAHSVLKKAGASIFAFWLNDLLDTEYTGVFHTGYRDHTVHTVYVYLLGLYLYASSEPVREMINKLDNRGGNHLKELHRPLVRTNAGGFSFLGKWALASLVHDIGYPLESSDKNTREQARKKLTATANQFAVYQMRSLFKHDELMRVSSEIAKDDSNGEKHREIQKEFVNKRGFGHIQDSFGHPGLAFHLPKDDDIVQYVQSTESLTPESLAGCLDSELGKNLWETVCGSLPSLLEVFQLFRNVAPNNEKTKRPEYLDHGFMSAALLIFIARAYQKWSDALNGSTTAAGTPCVANDTARKTQAKREIEEFIDGYGPSPGSSLLNAQERDDIKAAAAEWIDRGGDSILYQDPQSNSALRDVVFAIAVHNLRPEKDVFDKEPGYLYDLSTLTSPMCGIVEALQHFRFDCAQEDLFLASFLALCDTLQDWHRYGFVNPMRLKQKALSPLKVDVDMPAGDGEERQVPRFYFRGKAKDERFVDRCRELHKTENDGFSMEKRAELDCRFGRTWQRYVDVREA